MKCIGIGGHLGVEVHMHQNISLGTVKVRRKTWSKNLQKYETNEMVGDMVL